MLKKISGMMLLAFLMFLTGCPAIQDEPIEPHNDDPADKEVQTVKWVTDEDDFCRFYTNDRNYCGINGTSVYYLTNSDTTMDTVVTEVMKISGKSDYSFGIIFCGKENPGQSSDELKYDFYTTTIYADGYFRIAKRVSGIWKIIQAKKHSDSIYAVTNGINTIRIRYDSAANNFELSFNGDEVNKITFTDNTGTTPLKGGYYGYIADIGDDENFPNTPVEVKFKQTTPAL